MSEWAGGGQEIVGTGDEEIRRFLSFLIFGSPALLISCSGNPDLLISMSSSTRHFRTEPVLLSALRCHDSRKRRDTGLPFVVRHWPGRTRGGGSRVADWQGGAGSMPRVFS